ASPRYDLAPGEGAPAIEMTAMNAAVLIAANLIVALLASHLVEEIRRRDTAMASSGERMRRLSALHTGIVQSLGSGVLTVDREGRITSVNRAGAEILGFAEHELLLRPVEVAAPGFHKRIRSGELIDPSTGERGRWETVFPRRDGAERHLGFSASTLGVAGDPEAGHVVVFQDLTRIKDLEREVALGDRLRSLGEMAAAIAHEIRNPLASMSGCIEMLRRDPEIAARGGRLLGIVVRESDRLSGLITDFLAYARPDRVVREPVLLAPLIDDLTHMLRESGEAPPEVAVRAECAPDLRVEGDAKRLHQMLWNVVKNGLEALGGRGAIRIAAAPRGEDWAVVTVEDDGPGISPQDRDRIFELFFSTKSEGTGLGLALVHRIVEGHGGAVRVESSAVGTRFTIELPRGREGAEAARG
ncbi:MAG: PAS domain S-box protein, partial [Candidatus Methylomirabilis sp.]|nr:PAS domain S-box protein [Deltaproteobacteria bacterium]